MKIAIITDGNNKLGMGHVYQAMTLAERLSEKTAGKAEISFLTKSGGAVMELLKKTGRFVSHHDDDDSIFNFLHEHKPDRVIIDKLDVAPELAKNISEEINAKLIILTNLTEANRYADITVMAGMGSDFKNLRKEEANGQVQFWGPKYWLIRPEFFGFKQKKTISLTNIMLIFGGADQANLSSLVLEEILKLDTAFAITIVLGAAFANRSELDAVIGRQMSSRSTVQVVENLKAVAETMYKSDLVFVSPGLSFFEALSVGTAVLCFHQNEFQQEAWNGFIKTYDGNETFMIKSLLESRAFIFPNDVSIRAMEVGRGVDEIVVEILS